MPLLLTRRDLETVFADPEFLEQGFQMAQDLMLDTEPARTSSITLPLAQRGQGLSVRLRSPAQEGLCVGLRVGPAHGPYATDLAELLVAPDDGALLALAAADTLDAWRRAVPSGLAARYLAPAAARSLGLFGAGTEAWAVLRVLTRALPSLSVVRIYSRDTAADPPQATLADIMAGRALPRANGAETLVYQAGDVDGWDLAMQTWTLRRAWQLNIGRPFGLD
ncbi:hypothetical protein [Marinitenerispora sediminis]|uniref:hypothetical protein n=1 Tax=Marinitenerispora sediminis TaxID=1931232 RepID=UPI0015F14FC5|nr:hypothetical protein [Marinitenerispora sediminis]